MVSKETFQTRHILYKTAGSQRGEASIRRKAVSRNRFEARRSLLVSCSHLSGLTLELLERAAWMS